VKTLRLGTISASLIMAANSAKHAQITTILLQKHSLPVSPAWLTTQISTPRSGPNPPLPSLTQTALFRLLMSDFTTSLSKNNSSSLFPTSINDPNNKEQRLTGDIPVQLLSVEDIGSSKWSQIEAIERVERGEEVRGREIVRTVDVDNSDARGGAAGATAPATASSRGPHKYVVQDANGSKVTAFEKERIEKMGLGEKECLIGMKLVLKRGAAVRRGVVMLGKGDVNVLGGKVEAWDEAWKKGAKKRLMDAVSANS
jgi:RecQ-mediated genome instability protein 1